MGVNEVVSFRIPKELKEKMREISHVLSNFGFNKLPNLLALCTMGYILLRLRNTTGF